MQVQKSIEISDAKISYVSLVDKAANKRQFLITKADDGTAQFSTVGRIVKVDDNTHYLTGIVYEPMVEDAHGNFMTEAEIRKAAYWYAKNSDQVDIQHSFETAKGVSVVENYIAPCNMEIGDATVLKGTWLMTVEVQNDAIWASVQKGEITGFSMGGIGKYSEEDVSLEGINKKTTNGDETTEKKGVFKKLAALLGFDVVEKGVMMDTYNENEKYSGFWNAFYALEDLLYRYNWQTDRYELEADEATIKEALSDFSAIIVDLLTEKSITKALSVASPLNKAGKELSSTDMKKLGTVSQALTELHKALSEGNTPISKKEEIDLDKNELQAMIDKSIVQAVEPLKKALEDEQAQPPASTNVPAEGSTEGETSQNDVSPTLEALQEMIDGSVSKAIAPLLKALTARGIPSNLNGSEQVEKSEQHYLHGIL